MRASRRHFGGESRGIRGTRLAARLGYLVNSYLDRNPLGICLGADGMMRIAPGLVHVPDFSFVSWDRLPGRESPRVRSLTWRPIWPLKCSVRETPRRRWTARYGSISGWRNTRLADRSQETYRPCFFDGRQVGRRPSRTNRSTAVTSCLALCFRSRTSSIAAGEPAGLTAVVPHIRTKP